MKTTIDTKQSLYSLGIVFDVRWSSFQKVQNVFVGWPQAVRIPVE